MQKIKTLGLPNGEELQLVVDDGQDEHGELPGISLYVATKPDDMDSQETRLPNRDEFATHLGTISGWLLELLPDVGD